MRFQVSARVQEGNLSSNTAIRFTPEIKLPVVIVPGIQLNGSGRAVGDAALEAALVAYGYKSDGSSEPYPTVYGLDYYPDNQILTTNANFLLALIETIIDAEGKTYAGRVDVVAHSKGGLVARTYLSMPASQGKVRRLVMACTPHTGAAASILAYNFFFARHDAYGELFPTSAWWRASDNDPFGDHPDGANASYKRSTRHRCLPLRSCATTSYMAQGT